MGSLNLLLLVALAAMAGSFLWMVRKSGKQDQEIVGLKDDKERLEKENDILKKQRDVAPVRSHDDVAKRVQKHRSNK